MSEEPLVTVYEEDFGARPWKAWGVRLRGFGRVSSCLSRADAEDEAAQLREVLDAALRAAEDRGAAAECERIVAWLRREEVMREFDGSTPEDVADAIARGEHRP